MAATYVLGVAGADGRLSSDISVARGFTDRLRGLLGTDMLQPAAGLLLMNTNSIHTCFMSCAIDVVFLSHYLRVLSVAENVAPYRLKRNPLATHTLELPSGQWSKWALQIGAFLTLEEFVRQPIGLLSSQAVGR